MSKALDNVREFITPADELIVMDGGSTDRTPEVIRNNANIVSIFQSEKDYGGAHALNKGILLSKGRYLVNLSDDDYFFPDGMRKAIETMETHPEVDAVVCGGEYGEVDGETGQFRLLGYQRLPPAKGRLTDSVLNIVSSVQAGFLVLRREVIALCGLFDTTFPACDTDYMARLITCGASFKYLDVKMFRHVAYPHSAQNDYPASSRGRIRALLHNQAWTEVMKVFPSSAVAEVLGLNDLLDGDSLMRVIWYADHLRRSRLHSVLPLLVLGLDRCVRFKHWLDRQRRRSDGFEKSAASSKIKSVVEPIWDGELR